jgi:hypothetical protein
MGAPGTEAAIRLTGGEAFVLAHLAERMDGLGESTPVIVHDCGIATADDMLRRLRELGLVVSKRVPGTGNLLTWHATVAGRDAVDTRRWRQLALDVMERELKHRLSARGWDYARGWARRKLELTMRWPSPRLPADTLTKRQAVAKVCVATPERLP